MYICVIVSTVDVNDCIFCVNEQQKVYYSTENIMLMIHRTNPSIYKICDRTTLNSQPITSRAYQRLVNLLTNQIAHQVFFFFQLIAKIDLVTLKTTTAQVVVQTSLSKGSPFQDSIVTRIIFNQVCCFQVQTIFLFLKLYCQEKFETQQRVINTCFVCFCLFFFKNAMVTKLK